MENGLPSTSNLVDKVPLIKSPSFWIPTPIQLPPDIHPLPDDVQAYFVYPHSIESHTLTTLPSLLSNLQQSHSQRLHLLASLAESKERARKHRLNQIAPGWAEGGVMQPVRKELNPKGKDKGKDKKGRDLLEDSEGESPSTEGPKDDLFGLGEGGDQVQSPTEAGEATMDQLRRDQMTDFVDGLFKLDSDLGGKTGEGALI
ncbi:hypothetical protein BCR35DRAFT_306576 [Leucosporidium creatinivorum]|uniref:Uncharacterized protein n=1 Tax=Leucosporidium creatinivorum TaxID=106004 RepID=A0A1Y2ET74_9BASI|nr:hypothetical protein BCR35DRAFT_306576 [Leucosporidium creatinivorum]